MRANQADPPSPLASLACCTPSVLDLLRPLLLLRHRLLRLAWLLLLRRGKRRLRASGAGGSKRSDSLKAPPAEARSEWPATAA